MLWKDFFDFLKEYNIITLAVGFVMGAASNNLVRALVDDIVMPLITPLTPSGSWREAVWQVGMVKIAYGPFVSELLNFLILAFIVFLIVRKLLGLEREEGK